MPYKICFLQIQKDLQAAAFAAVDKTGSNRFVKKSYYTITQSGAGTEISLFISP